MFNRKNPNPDLKAVTRAIAYLNAAERELIDVNAKDQWAYHQTGQYLTRAKTWADELRYVIKHPYVAETEDENG